MTDLINGVPPRLTNVCLLGGFSHKTNALVGRWRGLVDQLEMYGSSERDLTPTNYDVLNTPHTLTSTAGWTTVSWNWIGVHPRIK